MKVWISRDDVRFCSDRVKLWSEKPYYEFDQSWVNNKDGQMSIGYIGRMSIEEFEKYNGYIPEKGSCVKYELS